MISTGTVDARVRTYREPDGGIVASHCGLITGTVGLSNKRPNRNSPEDFCQSEAAELYKAIIDRISDNYSLEHVMGVSKIMVSVGFDSSHTIVNRNNHNGLLQGKWREFLQDTLCFIETGKRKLSVTAWETVLRLDEKNHHAKWSDVLRGQVPEKDMLRYVTLDTRHHTYVAKWLARKNGFEDMLGTMKLLLTEVDQANRF